MYLCVFPLVFPALLIGCLALIVLSCDLLTLFVFLFCQFVCINKCVCFCVICPCFLCLFVYFCWLYFSSGLCLFSHRNWPAWKCPTASINRSNETFSYQETITYCYLLLLKVEAIDSRLLNHGRYYCSVCLTYKHHLQIHNPHVDWLG